VTPSSARSEYLPDIEFCRPVEPPESSETATLFLNTRALIHCSFGTRRQHSTEKVKRAARCGASETGLQMFSLWKAIPEQTAFFGCTLGVRFQRNPMTEKGRFFVVRKCIKVRPTAALA
jgi:hypothetical protein